MASSGTLLSDLDSNPSSGNDGDLVQRILADVNGGSSSMSAPPPPMPNHLPAHANPGYNAGMNSPLPNGGGMGTIAMDSRIPTAHVIGNEHPTSGDFARAMAGTMMQPPMGQMPGNGSPYGGAYPGGGYGGGGGYPQQQQQQQYMMNQNGSVYEPPRKNIYSRVVEEAKIPFVVAFLFFLFSLPPVRILLAHYLPQLIKPTGEFQMLGLLLVALLAGASFWLLQRVIVPLLAL